MTEEELLQRLTEIEWDDFECKAARERLTNGKVDFASDLVSSTITYWFGEQVSEQHSEQVSGQPGEQVSGRVGGIASDQVSDQAIDQVSDQVQRVINVIRDRVFSMEELMKKLNMTSRRYVRVNILNPAIDGGYVLRSSPDKPNHPKQRYYLSEKGLKLVK